jgi:flagellar basal body rod protein FlgB
MNLAAMVTDNIAELLVKIIEFTQLRQKVLTQNINEMHNGGFEPLDLPVNDFCDLLKGAIDEHVRNKRLLMQDTQRIRFGANGAFEAEATVDEQAKSLLACDRDKYLELQINKLLENSINQRVAAELLKQKRELC